MECIPQIVSVVFNCKGSSPISAIWEHKGTLCRLTRAVDFFPQPTRQFVPSDAHAELLDHFIGERCLDKAELLLREISQVHVDAWNKEPFLGGSSTPL